MSRRGADESASTRLERALETRPLSVLDPTRLDRALVPTAGRTSPLSKRIGSRRQGSLSMLLQLPLN